jgi:hypothetical protein
MMDERGEASSFAIVGSARITIVLSTATIRVPIVVRISTLVSRLEELPADEDLVAGEFDIVNGPTTDGRPTTVEI